MRRFVEFVVVMAVVWLHCGRLWPAFGFGLHLYIYICLKCTFIDSLYTCIQTFFFLRRSRVENWCKSVPFFLCPASAGKHCDDMTVTVKCLSVQVPQGRV